MKSQIAFAGKIEKLICDCHAGQFEVVALLLTPGLPDQVLRRHGPYSNEDEATKALEPFVKSTAETILKNIGIFDKVQQAELVVGDAANDRAKKFLRDNNPNLH